jgi:hypothetical protein
MPSADRQIFLVLCNYGRHGLAWAERDIARTDKRSTIEDIASGELCAVVQVIELNVAEFSSRDVTEDIMTEVASHLVPIFPDAGDRLAAKFDHNQDLRKNWSA